MKVLFISKHIPYQASSGIGIKMLNLLSCLSSVCNVTCVYIIEEENFDSSEHECTLPVVNRYINLGKPSNAFKRYARHLKHTFSTSRYIKNELSTIITQERPDLIWLEFGYICNLIPLLKNHNIPIFYCSHNSQFKLDFTIWMRNTDLVYKLKMAPFVALYYFHERHFLKLADKLLCISNQDISYYKEIIPESKIQLLPFYFDNRDISKIEAHSGKNSYICLIGSLQSYQNYSAAIFTLEKLWPLIQKQNKNYSLYIIGELPPSHSPEYSELMEKSSIFDNVVFTGIVPSVIPFLKGARVNIAPLLLGSGVRTKIIESVACKIPVVSTSIGAEGLPFLNGESIFIADKPETFSDCVSELIANDSKRTDVIDKAYSIYDKELSFDAGVQNIKMLLNEHRVVQRSQDFVS